MNILVLVTLFIIGFNILRILHKIWEGSKINIEGPKLFHPIVELFFANYKLGVMNFEERFNYINFLSTNYPKMVKFWLGPKITIFVNSPNCIQKVLLSSKCLEKWRTIYRLMERDDGLIAGSVQKKWKPHRKFFNISFGPNFLEMYSKNFDMNAKKFCKSLESELDKDEFDFFAKIKPVSFHILSQVFMGFNALKDLPNLQEVLDAYDT
jgi:hypothetical protein